MITSTSKFDLSNKFIYSTDFDKKNCMSVNFINAQIFNLIKRYFWQSCWTKIYRFILRNREIKLNFDEKILSHKNRLYGIDMFYSLVSFCLYIICVREEGEGKVSVWLVQKNHCLTLYNYNYVFCKMQRN